MAIKLKKAKRQDFPFTICQILNGFVSNNSKVLVFSHPKTAHGYCRNKEIKIQGAKVKMGQISKTRIKILYSPSKTQRNNP
jgi:hypothetical protein